MGLAFRSLWSLLTLVWLAAALRAMAGGFVGTTLGIQALLPAGSPPGVQELADVTVITWGTPTHGVRTASVFLGLFGGLVSALAVVVAPLAVVAGRMRSPLALGRQVLREFGAPSSVRDKLTVPFG